MGWSGRAPAPPVTNLARGSKDKEHANVPETPAAQLHQKSGRPLSVMALEMMLRRMKVGNATVHGFRREAPQADGCMGRLLYCAQGRQGSGVYAALKGE